MPMFQSFNSKTNRYVKFKKTKKGVKFVNVKQIKPTVPFKGIPIKKK